MSDSTHDNTTIDVVRIDYGTGRRLQHTWPTQAARCRALQHAAAGHVDVTSNPGAVHWLAGVDVGFPGRGHVTQAAIAVFDPATQNIVYSARARIPTRMPYIPGLLSFRELPAVFEALAALPLVPDLLMVDGQGVAHPRGVGTASHLGLVTGIPSIGVAKRRLTGVYDLPEVPGEATPLTDHTGLIGHALKTRERTNPVFVSPGHGIDYAEALGWVRRTLAGYRLPEPTRLADALTRDR